MVFTEEEIKFLYRVSNKKKGERVYSPLNNDLKKINILKLFEQEIIHLTPLSGWELKNKQRKFAK